jgi:hypothetical protein
MRLCLHWVRGAHGACVTAARHSPSSDTRSRGRARHELGGVPGVSHWHDPHRGPLQILRQQHAPRAGGRDTVANPAVPATNNTRRHRPSSSAGASAALAEGPGQPRGQGRHRHRPRGVNAVMAVEGAVDAGRWKVRLPHRRLPLCRGEPRRARATVRSRCPELAPQARGQGR